GDLAQRGGDEDHPLEHHEDADVAEDAPGEDSGDHRVAPELAPGPEIRESAHGGSPLPITIATWSSTCATRTSRPERRPSFTGSIICAAGPTSKRPRSRSISA